MFTTLLVLATLVMKTEEFTNPCRFKSTVHHTCRNNLTHSLGAFIKMININCQDFTADSFKIILTKKNQGLP